MVSNKLLAVIIILAVTVSVIATAAILVPAVGAWFNINLGPIGGGFVKLLASPLLWGASGGGPTIAVFYGVLLTIIFGFAYWVWHWDIGYKLSRGVANSPVLNYDNTMKREPDEPERSPTANPA